MINFGIVKPGSVLEVIFDSYAGATGASITLTGLAVTDIEIYKDGSTTQRASDSGYALLDTDGIDFDGITGIHGFTIDLADNATAGFYASGSRYFVIVSAVTVDGQTVNFVAAVFRIGLVNVVLNTTVATLASQTSFTLTAGPAEDDALNGCTVYIHDVASAVQAGFARVLDYTGSTKTVTLAAGTTFTVAATDNISVFFPMLSPALPAAVPGAANGLLIAGTNAPVTITGSGDALTLTSTGGNGSGINASANGTGSGIKTTAGATGHGLLATGGATSGHGIKTVGPTSGSGIEATGYGTQPNYGHGIDARALGVDGSGLVVWGKGDGDGITAFGDGATAAGIAANSLSGNTPGMRVSGFGTGAGLQANGGVSGGGIGLACLGGSGGSGAGIYAAGGATGNGIQVIGGTTSGDAFKATGTAGNANGIYGIGQGSGVGLRGQGGATGPGLYVAAGATSGSGIQAVGIGSGSGITTTGGATGHGVSAVGGATSGSGIQATATTSGDGFTGGGAGAGSGMYVFGGATGVGLYTEGGGTSGAGAVFEATAGNSDGITAIKAGTGKDINGRLTVVTLADTATALSSGERVSVADALLTRDMSAVTGEAARSPINALRFNRNKFTIVAGTLTVYEEDDVTVAWTAAITQTAGNPVSASDPA